MSYRSKSFIATREETASYAKRLSICLLPNGFSFSEIADGGELLAFGLAEGQHSSLMTNAIADVKAFFAEAGMKALGYKSMELVVPGNEHAWVPETLFSAGSSRNYLRMMGGVASSVLTYRAPVLGAVAVFSGNDSLATAFKVALPGLVVTSQHAKLALSPLAGRSKDHPLMVVHWRSGYLDVAVFAAGRYRFGNTLRASTDSDALFHIVEAMKTFGVDGPNAELLLCGEVDRKRYAMVSPYFPKTGLYTGEAEARSAVFAGLHTYRHALVLI